MLILPDSLKIKRAEESEESLLKHSRTWLEKDKRDPRIHVSDLLDSRLGYWQRQKPRPLSDKLVTTFLIGKVLHAFVEHAVDGDKSGSLDSDEGQKYSKALDLVYSIDKMVHGYPCELKTTRTFYEPNLTDDLGMYCEQLLCYMVAENKTRGQLWLLLLNFKDKKTGRTAPAYRCYTVTVTEADLKKYRKQMRTQIELLQEALERKDPKYLPLCREWKCGETNCDWWNDCQPEGRYGLKKSQWGKHEGDNAKPRPRTSNAKRGDAGTPASKRGKGRRTKQGG